MTLPPQSPMSNRASARAYRALLSMALFCVTACGGAAIVAPSTPLADSSASDAPQRDSGLSAMTESYEVAGVTVIHKHTPGSPVVALQLHLVGGVRGTRAEHAGLNVLMTNVLRLGDASRTKTEYAQALNAMGSGVSASSGYDSAVVSCSAVLSARSATWDLFADAVRDPAFREADLTLERERHLTGLRTREDDADTAVADAAKRAFFAGHAYATRPVGEEDTVTRFTRDDLVAAHARMFTRDRMLVSISGDVSRGDVEAFLEPLLRGFPMESDVAWQIDASEFAADAPRLVSVARPDLPTNYLLGYFNAPSPGDADFAATQMGLEVLGDQLFEEVRTARNLTYAVASGIGARASNSGYLYVTATDPETTVQVMLDTVDALSAEGGITEGDLRDQVELYLTRYWMGLQSNSGQAAELARWEMLGGGWENADRHIDALRSLTPAEVSAALEAAVHDITWAAVGTPDQVASMPLGPDH